MKNGLAAVTALIIGLNYCVPGSAVMAVQNEKLSEQKGGLFQDNEWESILEPENEESLKESVILPEIDREDVEGTGSDDTGDKKESEPEEPAADEKPAVGNLEIPQKMAIVIDPWEIDGKGQIYSEQYIVKNTGKTDGVLTLTSRVCKLWDKSEVIVKTDKRGLHDDKVKAVYMEMEYGNGDKVILSEDETKYQAELKPGEELAVRFIGEVNENASESWKDSDVTVDVVYSWSGKEVSAETEDFAEKDLEPGEEQNLEERMEEDSGEKEEIGTINLQISQSQEIKIDTWKTSEDGGIISAQYKVRNAGGMKGTLVFSELICKLDEESGIVVKTEKESLHGEEEKAVYMEMIIGDEEKFILNPESGEGNSNRYEVKLKPEEEKTFFFVGELKGIFPEELKEGDITATAVYTWTAGDGESE
ncbi:MAG: hypothetical protein HFH12_10150 [Dorea sp.]|nr:hypothetical protein [Dorea sp.]